VIGNLAFPTLLGMYKLLTIPYSLLPASLLLSLADGFVHEDAGGDGDVEAADLAEDGDGGELVAVAQHFVADTVLLVAHHYRYGHRVVYLSIIYGSLFGGAHYLDATLLQHTYGRKHVALAAYRHIQQPSRRGSSAARAPAFRLNRKNRL